MISLDVAEKIVRKAAEATPRVEITYDKGRAAITTCACNIEIDWSEQAIIIRLGTGLKIPVASVIKMELLDVKKPKDRSNGGADSP